uniref:INO80 complex subunit B-like conserved region domain-containing protein n=1 Tax=Arion vulgaris TaxID=1028688 RepID=A0A0B7A524_9EUPU
MELNEVSPGEPPFKKHKKHKKHKHKRESKQEQASVLMSPKTSIKLKLKIGAETMGTKNVMSIIRASSDSGTPEGKTVRKLGSDNDDTSDEERWLDALEKGNLNSYGEIGKKDPALLTARQKALLHGSQQDELLQLPSGYKTVELTDEQKKRRQEKAKRRRQQASEKIENDKNQTVHKLLKKQDSKNKRAAKARGGKRSNSPRVTYRNGLDRITINLPPDVAFPLTPQIAKPYPETQLCGVGGCTNKRTSTCSKTLVPICGLQCYQRNLAEWNASNNIDSTTGT